MIPGLGLGVASFALNAVAWLGGGKIAAKAACKADDFRTKYVQPTLDRMRGVRPPLLKVVRLSEGDGVVFSFENVEIINYDEKNAQIKAESSAILKTYLDEKVKNEVVIKPYENGKPTGILYDVKLKIKNNDIRLGEIDFSNWDANPDFDVIVTPQNAAALDLQKPEDIQKYTEVLATLKRVVKTTYDQKLNPNDVAVDKIGLATDYGKWFEPVTRIFDWGKEKVTGKVIRQYVAIDDGKNSHLTESTYIDSLAELVASKEEKGDKLKGNDILENYYGSLEQQIRNELLIVQDLRKTLEADLESKKSTRRKARIILLGMMMVVALATVGLIALTIFNVGVGLAVTALVFEFVNFFGSKIFAGLFSASVVTLIAGVVKGTADYIDEMIETDKVLLENAATDEKELIDGLVEVHAEKKGADLTLEAIRELRSKNLDSLEMSVSKENTTNKIAIGDFGLKIICKYLGGVSGPSSCNRLQLSNNRITADGVVSLAKMLKTAATNPNLNIREIDLTGNVVGVGMEALQDALENNFTVTNFSCDVKNDAVNRQLLINRYIQDIPVGIDSKHVNELFPKEIQAAAIEKIERNFDIIAFPSAIRINQAISAQVNNIIKQNKFFAKLYKDKTARVENFIEAFNVDPARCLKFISSSQEDAKSELMGKVLIAIESNPLMLRNLSFEKRLLLLQEFKGKDGEITVKLLADIIEKLPEEVGPAFKPSIMAAFSKILKNHKAYADSKKFEAEIKILREAIANLDGDKVQKEVLIRAFDAIVYSDISERQRRLNRILECPDSLEALNEFIDIYKIEFEAGAINFTPAQLKKVRSLMRLDIPEQNSYYPRFAKFSSKSINEEQRQALLRLFFQGEPDYENKAVLLSAMIQEMAAFSNDENVPQIIKDLKDDLYWSFYPGKFTGGEISYRDYNDLKKRFITKRQEALKSDNNEMAVTIIDHALQAAFQAEIVTILLSEDSKENKLKKLTEYVNENHELRNFEFPPEMDSNIKCHIMRIINRNKFCDAVADYQLPEVRLAKFLGVYANIMDENERQDSLDDLMSIASFYSEALLKLIKEDIDNHARELRGLEELQRTEILMACLKDNPAARGIAVMTSKLIGLRVGVSNKTIFDQPFTQYIDEVKSLRDANPDGAQKIDKIIQIGLQEDLINRFECLRGMNNPMYPSSFEKLRKELEQNYDLIEFDLIRSNANVGLEVKEHIEFICQRNLLKKYSKILDLDRFMQQYTAIAPERCKAAVLALDKLTILKMLAKDLGKEGNLNCENLRNLGKAHKAHLVALLEHGFSIEKNEQPDVTAKAKLVSELLELDDLFDENKNTRLIQEVKKLLYWSISVEGWGLRLSGVPYYKFKELEDGLRKVLSKMPENEPSLEKIRKGLTHIFSENKANELQESDVNLSDKSNIQELHLKQELKPKPRGDRRL